MKIKNAKEEERVVRVYCIDDNNKEDDFIVRFSYNKDKWSTNLSGEYEEEELDAVRKILMEINKNHKTPIELNFDEKKK